MQYVELQRMELTAWQTTDILMISAFKTYFSQKHVSIERIPPKSCPHCTDLMADKMLTIYNY